MKGSGRKKVKIQEAQATKNVVETQEDDAKMEQEQNTQWVDEHDLQTQIDLSKITSRKKLIKKDKQSIVSGVEFRNRTKEMYNTKIQNTSFLQWANKTQELQNEQGTSLGQLLSQNISIRQDGQQTQHLNSELIDIQLFGFTKRGDKGDSVVQTISFHNKLPIFLTGSYDKVLRIYQIHPEKQKTIGNVEVKGIKSIYLEKFPIIDAQFMNTSNIILAASFKKKYLISYNFLTNEQKKIKSTLISDQLSVPKRNQQIKFCIDSNDTYVAIFSESGYINIIDGQSFQNKFQFKQNEQCYCACFYEDFLLSSGQSGRIYQWSLSKRQIFNIIACPGAFIVNCLDCNSNSGILCAGTQTGIVNVFKFDKQTQKFEKDSIKEIQNLSTSICSLQINRLGELMCFTSKVKPNQMRLVHLDSLTVYQNWPNLKTNLKSVNAISFSNDSKYLAFGNELGEVSIYRLQHY